MQPRCLCSQRSTPLLRVARALDLPLLQRGVRPKLNTRAIAGNTHGTGGISFTVRLPNATSADGAYDANRKALARVQQSDVQRDWYYYKRKHNIKKTHTERK